LDHRTTTLDIYHRLIKASRQPAPRLELWNGEWHGPAEAPSTLVLRHPGAIRSLVLPGTDLTAGESYIYDDIDIEGDILHALRFASGLEGLPPLSAPALRVAALALKLPSDLRRLHHSRPSIRGRLHTPLRDRTVVSHHYDTGNEFFATFLGETMVYSCAYFLDEDESLGTAQIRKLDVICRKLELSPGDRLLDVGCGWGSMVIHAARRHGVRATGITLSHEQAEFARQRVSEAGLEDQVEVLVRDYREMAGEFDAISSIGMVEHVGRQQLPEYFQVMRRLLAPGGLFLNHGIVDRRDTPPRRRRRGFVGTYVFPDGDLLPLATIVNSAEEVGFETRDIEAMRRSYVLTLERWVKALESSREKAIAASSQTTYRIWRLYLAGSAVAFDLGAIGVHQSLLSDPARGWTYGRRHLVATDDAADRMNPPPADPRVGARISGVPSQPATTDY
jgi:cyclopropane-fatty-acyl-phospholipid synthase